MNNNQKIAIGVVLLALIAYYIYNKNKSSTTTPPAATPSGSTDTTTPVTPAPVNGTLPIAPPVVIGAPTASFVAMGSSASSAPNTSYQDAIVTPGAGVSASVVPDTTPNGIDPKVYAAVQAWAKADGRAPVLAMAAAAVPSEYAGMYNIIVNYFPYAGKVKPPDVVAFWNNLRSKYDPTHKSW